MRIESIVYPIAITHAITFDFVLLKHNNIAQSFFHKLINFTINFKQNQLFVNDYKNKG